MKEGALLSPVRARGLLAAVLVTIGMACSDATGPAHRTYDITTSLDSFTFETACPPSPNGMLYCAYAVPANGLARLSGSVTVSDNWANPAFTGAFCDQADRFTGCSHASPVAMDSALGAVVSDDPLTLIARFSLGKNHGAIVLDGTSFDGETIRGRVSWTIVNDVRFPSIHSGTFIARPRR